MEDLIKYIVSNLVEDFENVIITSEGDNIIVKVPKKDIGKVIGKQGRIAKSIRTIIKAVSKEENKITLDIVEIEA